MPVRVEIVFLVSVECWSEWQAILRQSVSLWHLPPVSDMLLWCA
jgi:hypothetical protein